MCKHQNIRDNQKNENLARNNAKFMFSFLVICTIDGSLLEYSNFIIKTDILPLKHH